MQVLSRVDRTTGRITTLMLGANTFQEERILGLFAELIQTGDSQIAVTDGEQERLRFALTNQEAEEEP